MRARTLEHAVKPATVVALSLLLASCVRPVHKVSLDESFMRQDAGRKAWRRIAVLPFAGNPVFRRTAPEWLAFRARNLGLFEVVGPSLAEIELGKKGAGFGDAVTSPEAAQKSGRLLDVDGVVYGSVGSSGQEAWDTGGVGAGIVDVATGKVVADCARSPLPRGRSGRQSVIAAVDAVAEDLVPMFYAAAGKVRTPPPKSGADVPRPPAREARRTGR